MTLDHDQTATQFVRDYILEKNSMRVGELRESIQTYRNINETIRKMREKLDALKALRQVLDELEDAYERKHREQWIAKRADWLAARAANRDFKSKSGSNAPSATPPQGSSSFSPKRSGALKGRWSGSTSPSPSTMQGPEDRGCCGV